MNFDYLNLKSHDWFGSKACKIKDLKTISNLRNIKTKKYFENLTMAPIDKNLIELKLLKEDELNWLNNYHRKVFMNLKNSMNKIELKELKKACSAV